MRLLAIDPGTERLGYAVYDDQMVLADGVFQTEYRLPSEFLLSMTAFVDSLVEQHSVACVASERMFDFMAMKGNKRRGGNSALLKIIPEQLKNWCELRGLPFLRYSPMTIKKCAAGRGDAEKADVRKVMIGKFTDASRRLDAKSQEDVADAHGVAWTAIANHYAELPKKIKTRKSSRSPAS